MERRTWGIDRCSEVSVDSDQAAVERKHYHTDLMFLFIDVGRMSRMVRHRFCMGLGLVFHF